MDSREQLEILEEDGLLIIPSSRRRLALRSLTGGVLVIAGAALCSAAAAGLESAAQIFLRPALWLGAVILVLGAAVLLRTRTIRRSGLQLILTDESLVLEHRPRGTWTTLHRLPWDEIISFAPARGPVPFVGGCDHVSYTLRPRAARRFDDRSAPRSSGWAERATAPEGGRGAIPRVVGSDPASLLELLRAAHRRFG